MEETKLDVTVPGGLYLGSDGKTYHDANGNILSNDEVAKRKEQAKRDAEVKTEESQPAEEVVKVEDAPVEEAEVKHKRGK